MSKIKLWSKDHGLHISHDFLTKTHLTLKWFSQVFNCFWFYKSFAFSYWFIYEYVWCTAKLTLQFFNEFLHKKNTLLFHRILSPIYCKQCSINLFLDLHNYTILLALSFCYFNTYSGEMTIYPSSTFIKKFHIFLVY